MSDDLNLEFVLIPEGEFIIGSRLRADRLAQSEEFKQHRLYISDYYIMRYPVTNRQYHAFCQATGHRPPLFGWPDGEYTEAVGDHPVVGVSIQDGYEFCQWAAGVTGLPLRLPTEPEWEKAARGTDGRIYPWGNHWDPSLSNNCELKYGGTTPVKMFSPKGDSCYGVSDMAGNVQNWCSSLFGPYPYDPQDGREIFVYAKDPVTWEHHTFETGCTSNPQAIEAFIGKSVLRGGSWREDRGTCRCAYRSWAAPLHRSDDTGFRCCYEPA